MTTTDRTLEIRERNRHRTWWRIVRALAGPFVRWRMGYTAEKAPAINAPVLVLSNHNTDLDPALVALSFDKQMYFVASEHIFRWGWITRVIRFLFAPIPLIKGRSDAHAAMGILRALRKGQNVCIFAEGNRSVDGITAPISPATGILARAGTDLVTYRLEGGYFTQPRWAKTMRRGKMRGYVVGHYTAEQLKAMRIEEINEIIRRDLHEDAYARQAEHPIAFRGKRLAEQLETALYLCPACEGVGGLKSKDDRLTCSCGLSVQYTETGMLAGENAPFDTVAKWYAWQATQTNRLIDGTKGDVLLRDEGQRLYQIVPCESATLIAAGGLSMTRDALLLGEHTFPLSDIAAIAIVGQSTITFSLHDGRHYEIKGDAPRSGYKYVNVFDALRERAATEKTPAKG